VFSLKYGKRIFLITILIIFISSVLNIYQYIEYNNLNQKVIKLNIDLEKLSDITNLLDETIVIKNISKIWYHSYSNLNNNYYSIFYNNELNSTLEVDFYILQPSSKIILPISLQKGNVLNRNDATSEYTFYHFYNGTFLPYNLKAAPIVFFQNITSPITVRVPLPEKGWYTFSSLGPISVSDRFYGMREIYIDEIIVVDATFRIKINEVTTIFAEKNH
jgi:hypothetical protein